MKKTKRFVTTQKWGFEGSGQGSSEIQSQEGQELTTTADALSLVTEKSSDHQIVDVTIKDTVNRYLRVFHHVLHLMVYNRTSSPYLYLDFFGLLFFGFGQK
jgi:hypothetical protein